MKRFFVALVAALSFLLLWLSPRDASAYPWMIREGYTGCATCHADPSGAGLLTAYGRAQSALLLSLPTKAQEDGEAPKASEALFGLLPEPENFLYSLAYRGALFATKTEGGPASARYIVMQADARAQVTFAERFRVNASVGFVPSGGQLAAIVRDFPAQIVSREHWVGVDLGEERTVLLRAGRIAVPYGLRGNEHAMWIRTIPRVDLASHQQHGVALSRSAEAYRTEIMALLGNYQLAPDLYRERGYAGFFEHRLGDHSTLGVSSLLTHAQGDIARSRRQPILRHAHGLFARHVLARPVVLMAEADVVARHPEGRDTEFGYVGLAQADLELIRGVHLLPAFELQKPRYDLGGAGLGAWLSAAFFPYSHVELRADLVGRSLDSPAGRVANVTALVHLHLYL
ncbi:MAG TPA: hypothetical protein VM580_20140 [Labilithrix sp.]|nr:hypothetical protein [Labilithrix sp.]